MKIIIITTQAELDKLPQSFEEFTRIEIKSTERIIVSRSWGNSRVVAWDNSSVVAQGNSSVVARENSRVVARDNSRVEAWENSSVVARENSRVEAWENSRVEAWGNSRVEAWGNSSVVAWGNSRVEAWGNSRVEAWGNSRVEAWGNSRVEAWENSSVVAWENSSVVAWGNSRVEAWGNSRVEANDFSMIAILESCVVIKKLLDYSIASFREMKSEVGLKHDTATVVETPKEIIYTKDRFFDRCESFCDESIILYKSVRLDTLCDFQTGKIKYEGIVDCPDWKDDESIECGNGLHLSPTKGDALSYHNGKLLKCRVFKADINVYLKNITKVRCRKVEVLGPA